MRSSPDPEVRGAPEPLSYHCPIDGGGSVPPEKACPLGGKLLRERGDRRAVVRIDPAVRAEYGNPPGERRCIGDGACEFQLHEIEACARDRERMACLCLGTPIDDLARTHAIVVGVRAAGGDAGRLLPGWKQQEPRQIFALPVGLRVDERVAFGPRLRLRPLEQALCFGILLHRRSKAVAARVRRGKLCKIVIDALSFLPWLWPGVERNSNA